MQAHLSEFPLVWTARVVRAVRNADFFNCVTDAEHMSWHNAHFTMSIKYFPFGTATISTFLNLHQEKPGMQFNYFRFRFNRQHN
jgi:hypothetical protein